MFWRPLVTTWRYHRPGSTASLSSVIPFRGCVYVLKGTEVGSEDRNEKGRRDRNSHLGPKYLSASAPISPHTAWLCPSIQGQAAVLRRLWCAQDSPQGWERSFWTSEAEFLTQRSEGAPVICIFNPHPGDSDAGGSCITLPKNPSLILILDVDECLPRAGGVGGNAK